MRTWKREQSLLSGLVLMVLQLGPIHGWTATPPAAFRNKMPWCRARPHPRLAFTILSSTGGNDGEALQALFNQQCDKDGLMTKSMLLKVPPISDLLEDGDLLSEELDDIWEAAPKFPDVQQQQRGGNRNNARIDVDSFVQIYRDIDDLFEDEEQEESDVAEELVVDDEITNQSETLLSDEIQTRDEEEQELEGAFLTICNRDKLVSKEALRNWNEVDKLIQEELLGEDEFEDLWKRTAKSPGSSNKLLDVDGFLSFNVALDDLFVFDDEELDDEEEKFDRQEEGEEEDSSLSNDMVVGEDLPPGVLFSALANKDYLVGMKELQRWAELQEMLQEEELLPLELRNIFDDVAKAPGTDDMLDEAGFTALWEAIDSLFEDVDDVEDDSQTYSPPQSSSEKEYLLRLLSELNSDQERLPCGLESTEREELQVKKAVTALEESPSNTVLQKQGEIEPTDLAGDWELLYSSSSAMKFNKGLSGLGGSIPNGRFGGLVQKLKATKYLADVEYVERIEMNPSSASFDVRVTGDWDLRRSVSLFTGAPSTVMTVEPAKVMYGPTSTKADHWKSLGPLNMLDVTYLDDNLRIMRGNTSTDSIFIFRRTRS